jgi:acyl-CoA reductase-like NAD-dependent aldehyde dehydrogenase
LEPPANPVRFTPFGGVDFSGMGREGGRQAIHDYLNVKLTHFAWA